MCATAAARAAARAAAARGGRLRLARGPAGDEAPAGSPRRRRARARANARRSGDCIPGPADPSGASASKKAAESALRAVRSPRQRRRGDLPRSASEGRPYEHHLMPPGGGSCERSRSASRTPDKSPVPSPSFNPWHWSEGKARGAVVVGGVAQAIRRAITVLLLHSCEAGNAPLPLGARCSPSPRQSHRPFAPGGVRLSRRWTQSPAVGHDGDLRGAHFSRTRRGGQHHPFPRSRAMGQEIDVDWRVTEFDPPTADGDRQ